MKTASMTICVICLPMLVFGAEELATKRVKLGGPRKVVAEITEADDCINVVIEMLAIRSFDTAMNSRLSREKAEHYAHEALARHFQPESGNQMKITLSGATVQDSSLMGKQFRLTLRVPRSGVAVKQNAEKPATSDKGSAVGTSKRLSEAKAGLKLRSKPNLFEIKGDYAETLRLLTETLKASIPISPVKSDSDHLKQFFTAIADLEEQAEQNYSALISEMRQEKLLLTSDAAELVQQAETSQAELIELLKTAVEANTPKPSDK